MKNFFFLRIPLVLFLTGLLIWFIGTIIKMRHLPVADELITFGSIISALGILFAIFKILLVKK